jgi:hypothetical protein
MAGNVIVQNALTTAYQNYARILVLVTQQIASPSQANVDAIAAGASTAGILQPKPTYNVDGENVLWMEYQTMIIDKMLELEQAIQRASGPFEVRSRGF